MKLNRITVIVFTVFAFAHSLAAQEKLDIDQADNVTSPPPFNSEQEFTLKSTLEKVNPPAQVIVQTEDKFLSEMKVYPSF